MNCGLPVLVTFSLKVTVPETTSPALSRLFCPPEALLIDTLLTVGAVVSPVTAKLLVAALVLPAASVSFTLNW